MAIDRAQALLRGAMRELSESFSDHADAAHGSIRLMGSAMVSQPPSGGIDLTFTAFLSDATAAASQAAQAGVGSMRIATSMSRKVERQPGFLSS